MKRKATFLIVLLAMSMTVLAQGGVTASVLRNLSLRSGPGTNYDRITVMRAGTTVVIDGRDASGIWLHGVTQSGQAGWMHSQHISLLFNEVAALPVLGNDASVVGVPAPQPAAAPAASAGQPGAGIGVALANVNVRSGPGTNFARIGRVVRGEQFAVDGRNAVGNWVRGVSSSGQAGWVSAAYFSGLDLAALPIVEGLPQVAGSGGVGAPPPAAPAGGGSVAAPANVPNTAATGGFALGGHVQGLSDRTINAMRQAGMSWVKYQVRYSQGQDPGSVAGLIADAHSKGFSILLGIVGHRDQVNNGNYFNDYANFVGGVAALGANGIEVWNEQNIDREWPSGQIDPGRYTQLLAASYAAIKSRNPSTLVISGALAPTGFFGGCSANGCDDAPYIRGMAAAGAANHMDCLGIHYNEGIISPTQSSGDPRGDHYTRYYQGMVNTYLGAMGSRPLCFTELGYLSPEGLGSLPGNFGWAGGTSVAQQAQWLDEAVNLARGSGRVRLLIVWNVDFTNFGSDPMAGYAMIRPDGSCPACAALGS